MALDEEELATRARERITEMGEGDVGFTVARLMTFINDARQGLTDLLASENEGEYQYIKTFTIDAGEVTDGVASVASALTADEPLVLESLTAEPPQARVYIEGYPYQLRMMPDRSYLTLDATKTPSYAVEDQNLYIKGSDGKIDTFNEKVRISGAYIPSLANVRPNHVRKLIDVLVAIALASTKQATQRSARKPATAAA